VSSSVDTRPLLLLDVDGVLQPVGSAVPPGFERLELADSVVVLNRAHGDWLRDVAELFEIVWASTWAASANELIGSRLGLPAVAHIELGTLGTDGTRKLRSVQTFVADRSFAWIDDELFEDAFEWAASRPERSLLIRTQAYVGMTAEHVRALEAFAARPPRSER
jgi:hypothetical protein